MSRALLLFRALILCGFVAAWGLYGTLGGLVPASDTTDDVRGGAWGTCNPKSTDTCRPKRTATPCETRYWAGVCLCPSDNIDGCSRGITHPTCKWNCTATCAANSCGGTNFGFSCGTYISTGWFSGRCSIPSCAAGTGGLACGGLADVPPC